MVHGLQGAHKRETQPDSGDLPYRHFDFDLGSPELLGFRGYCPDGASGRDCYYFEPAARPDGHTHSEPVTQPYPTYSDGYTIPDGNCHPATQPYAGSNSSANRNGDIRAPAQRTRAGDGFRISPHR